MTRNLLLIGLGLSLLFNVFVLIGFARARTAAAKATDNTQIEKHITSELHLNPQQAKVLSDLRADHRQQTEFYDESVALLRQNLMTELRKEDPDLERVRELVKQESEMHQQRRLAGADLFGRFVGELTPQQRRQMIGRFLNMRGPQGQQLPKGAVEKFDANKNGRLDPDEMRRAMQEMERRRERMRQSGQLPPGPQGPHHPPPTPR